MAWRRLRLEGSPSQSRVWLRSGPGSGAGARRIISGSQLIRWIEEEEI